VDLLLELCRGGMPAEARLVEKVFSGEALERLASAGLVAVEGGVVKPLACRGGGGRLVFPPAHMGYVVVPWLKKALGASPPLVVADARLRGRLEVEAVYVSDLGEREFYYSLLGLLCVLGGAVLRRYFDFWGAWAVSRGFGVV